MWGSIVIIPVALVGKLRLRGQVTCPQFEPKFTTIPKLSLCPVHLSYLLTGTSRASFLKLSNRQRTGHTISIPQRVLEVKCDSATNKKKILACLLCSPQHLQAWVRSTSSAMCPSLFSLIRGDPSPVTSHGALGLSHSTGLSVSHLSHVHSRLLGIPTRDTHAPVWEAGQVTCTRPSTHRRLNEAEPQICLWATLPTYPKNMQITII